MSSLTALCSLFEQKRIRVTEFGGWYIVVGKDRWTMFDDQIYLNGILINNKDIQKYINQ